MGSSGDFACEHGVVVQREFNSQQEWIQPTAVMISSFYLCMEAQLTGEIAYAAFTQIVAIRVLDYMTRPWNRVSLAVRSTSSRLFVHAFFRSSEFTAATAVCHQHCLQILFQCTACFEIPTKGYHSSPASHSEIETRMLQL